MNATSNDTNGAYAPVNGLQMYYEVHGSPSVGADGPLPLVLLHGGILNIDLNYGRLIPILAKDRQVIALEFQGHGRTADTDRDLSIDHFASDVVGLLDHLGIERADVFGFSLGGLTALQTGIGYPERVGRQVLVSTHYRHDGYYDEIFDPAAFGVSTRLPTQADFEQMREAYLKIAPHPDHFEAFMAKNSAAVAAFQGWSDDALRGIAAPTLLVIGDNDFVRIEHAAAMHALIPDSRLAVLPGTTHMTVTQRLDLLLPALEPFLR